MQTTKTKKKNKQKQILVREEVAHKQHADRVVVAADECEQLRAVRRGHARTDREAELAESERQRRRRKESRSRCVDARSKEAKRESAH